MFESNSKSSRQLTEEDKKFLDVLFNEAEGVPARAGKILGIHPYHIFHKLQDEIIERAKAILAINSIKAANAMVEGLDVTENSNAAQLKMMCAEKILDRVGIIKKEKIDLGLDSAQGIFILPAKEMEKFYARNVEAT